MNFPLARWVLFFSPDVFVPELQQTKNLLAASNVFFSLLNCRF
jgi:hypothetical protein